LKQNILEIIADFDIKRLPRNLEAKAINYIDNFSKIDLAENRLDQIKFLLTLISNFLKRYRKKKEIELDSLLLYLFYCILMACPRNMVSDVKLLYMSLSKEDEIRILGNLAVQLLASLQYLSSFISELCRKLRVVNKSIYDKSQVEEIRRSFNLEIIEKDEIKENVIKIKEKEDEMIDELSEKEVNLEFHEDIEEIDHSLAILPNQAPNLKKIFNEVMSDEESSEDEFEKKKEMERLSKSALIS
jgi:hypothetical protein